MGKEGEQGAERMKRDRPGVEMEERMLTESDACARSPAAPPLMPLNNPGVSIVLSKLYMEETEAQGRRIAHPPMIRVEERAREWESESKTERRARGGAPQFSSKPHLQ